MILGNAAWQVWEKPVSKKTKTEGQKRILRAPAYEMNAPPATLICTISSGKDWKLARNPSHITHAALCHYPLLDNYFKIDVKKKK